MSKKALLFINGQPPILKSYKDDYKMVICTDGAYHYVKELPVKLDIILGDFDSKEWFDIDSSIKKIYTPDQNKTDFQKAIEYLVEQNIETVEIYGATGMEHDHFLGNLSVALQFKEKIKMIFYDDYSTFYFTDFYHELIDVMHKTISLYPFPEATKVTTTGLLYSLDKIDLNIQGKIGTRNIAIENEVTIQYESGNLLTFVSNF